MPVLLRDKTNDPIYTHPLGLSRDGIAQISRRDTFEKVYEGLLAQGRKSYDGNVCVYRLERVATSQTKCAAGQLIPDDRYDSSFENSNWDALAQMFPEYDEQYDFIKDLQAIHDDKTIRDIYRILMNMVKCALKWGLSYDILPGMVLKFKGYTADIKRSALRYGHISP